MVSSQRNYRVARDPHQADERHPHYSSYLRSISSRNWAMATYGLFDSTAINSPGFNLPCTHANYDLTGSLCQNSCRKFELSPLASRRADSASERNSVVLPMSTASAKTPPPEPSHSDLMQRTVQACELAR